MSKRRGLEHMRSWFFFYIFSACWYENCVAKQNFPASMASSTAATGWLRGIVKAVPSGDTLLIMGSTKAEIPPEKLIGLSSITAPRLVRKFYQISFRFGVLVTLILKEANEYAAIIFTLKTFSREHFSCNVSKIFCMPLKEVFSSMSNAAVYLCFWFWKVTKPSCRVHCFLLARRILVKWGNTLVTFIFLK